MKNRKEILWSLIVLSMLGGALALKAGGYFGPAGVFCAGTCAVESLVNFRVDPKGNELSPCGGHNQPYVLKADPTHENECVPTRPGTRFSPMQIRCP